MRAATLCALVLAVGCGRAKEVHVTISAGGAITSDAIAKIRTLDIAVLGDEPDGIQYGISGELDNRKTTWIYRAQKGGRLQFEVVARDADTNIIGSGKSKVVKTGSAPVEAKVTLGTDPPNFDKARLGASCVVGMDTCASGFCVDGVCCNVACEGACNTCNGSTPGTCTPAVDGTDPRKECVVDATKPCGLDGMCDGKGACRQAPSGKTCSVGTCVNGMATAASSCDGNGTCVVPAPRDCTPYVCNLMGSACATICTAAAGCATTATCTSGSCGQVQIGARCFSSGECGAGSCVDGICCDSDCTGACQSCKEAGHEGHCTNTPVGHADPHTLCTDAGAPSCGTNGTCDGAGGCQKYAAGTQCAPGRCSTDNASFSAPTVCAGDGTACPTAPSASCAPYLCVSDDGAPGCDASCGDCIYYAAEMSPPFQASCAAGKTCTNHCLDAAARWTCD